MRFRDFIKIKTGKIVLTLLMIISALTIKQFNSFLSQIFGSSVGGLTNKYTQNFADFYILYFVLIIGFFYLIACAIMYFYGRMTSD